MDIIVETSQKDCIEVRNPFNNQLLGEVPKDSLTTVRKAIDTAAGFTKSNRLTAWERYEILRRFSDLLISHAAELAQLISAESGKTIRDAAVEVKRAHQAFLLSAEEAKRINGELVPLDAVAGMEAGLAMVMREPIGVVAAITPFNFPLNLVAHKVGPAIAANNPVIVKPSEFTPLTALRMRGLLLEAGLPKQMLQIVNGDPVQIVDIFCSDSRIKKISFTGSVAVGHSICRKAGMTRLAMELGGNDPMIILDDADLDLAIPLAVDGAFGSNGQRCTSVKRFIVQNEVADEFIKRFVLATRALKVGDQLDPGTDIGPLICESAARKIEGRVQQSVSAGANLLLGGRFEGALMWPVILDHVVMSNPIVTDETFGPVAPFIRVNDLDEAIQVANDTPFGLQSGVFTRDLNKAKQAIARIEAGAVMINRAPGFRAEHLPFGGTKDSGLGREGIKYAVESMTQLKTVVL